jgi:hypothetical protein
VATKRKNQGKSPAGRRETVVYNGRRYTVHRPGRKTPTVVLKPIDGSPSFRLQYRAKGRSDAPCVLHSEEFRPGVFLKGKKTTDPGVLGLFRGLTGGTLAAQPRAATKKTTSMRGTFPTPYLTTLEITRIQNRRYNGERVKSVWSKTKPTTVFLVADGRSVATIFRRAAIRGLGPGRRILRVPKTLMVREGKKQRHANRRELNLFNSMVTEEHRFSEGDFKAQRRKPLK